MDNFSSTGFVVCIVLGIAGANNFTGCRSPQYLHTGSPGTISCSFQDNFLSVYWYDTDQYVRNDAIMKYQSSVKWGEGYESGMFDVHQNGSLIINNVSLEDDHIFTAVEARSVGDYKTHFVRVIVTVKPAVPHPVIQNCGQVSTMCYVQLTRGTELSCYVEEARPAIALNWVTRTVNGDRNLSSVFETTSNGLLNTSTSTTHDPLAYTSWLNLLVCQAYSLPGVLADDESLAIVETDKTGLTSRESVSKYVEMKSNVVLSCLQRDNFFFVWKHRQKANNVFNVIAYGVHWYSTNSTFESGGYNLTNNGGLRIPELLPKHEGLYACIAGTGAAETVLEYEITAYVPPDPAYPLVVGCGRSGYCVLAVNRQGNLTCNLNGIRPEVNLIWKTFDDISPHEILLYDSKRTASTNEDGTFDVQLMTFYDATRSTMGTITMECKVSEVEMKTFHLSTKLDLLFVESVSPTGSNTVSNGTVQDKWWIFILVIIVVFIVIMAVVWIRKGKHLKRRLTKYEDENYDNEQRYQLHVHKGKATKKEFIQQLRAKYADLTANVRPVPYLRETMYSVHDVFVESGYEFLLKPNKWETLDSYHQIFSDSRLYSSRRIIEGDPGYGKSTLTLQFAFDWYKKVKESPLATKDIFILLQLRQLEGVKSIAEAIKGCLLPKDTTLSSKDIDNILQGSKSVLVVLDGYDEYPHKGDGNTSFIEDIMEGKILQGFDVILTTRTACLPKNSPQTKKIRMNGFDDKAKEAYLQKVLVGDNHAPIERIQEKLKENPFLEDLCHIPLFFALFSHLSNDEKSVLKFNSVTTFFRHIISCLHSHMKNKTTDSTGEIKLVPYEKNHKKLDKVAFEGLSGERQRLVWQKESICQQLGKDFYNHYVSMGVLQEERVQFFNDVPGTYSSEHILYRQEVRFYHKLFCEWYAAHFLADYAANPEVSLDPRHDDENSRSQKHEVDSLLKDPNQEVQKPSIENLDPADVQYVYRFACGLNFFAAEKIYQYLTNTHGGEKFAILCILEQTGKLEEIKPTIENLCAGTVTFRCEHSRLVQRSTIQLLEIAASLEIPIANLWLTNCFEDVCDSSRSIMLKSGLKICRLNTLLALHIRENGRTITEEEALGIFEFCIQCRQLKSLKFKNCIMPRIIHTKQTKSFQKKPITVVWDTGFASCFTLNLKNGSWQHPDGSRSITDDEYEKERRRHEHPEV